jgi:hypothetical protein
VILADNFEDGSSWNLTATTSGSAAVGLNQLTIVLLEPRAYVASLRQDLFLTDFYAEIRVDTSLCAGQDEFGLILRAASPSEFYRFSLTCNGYYRLDRIIGGTASSPQPLTFSSAVPRAAPATIRLGVFAQGSEMRFFINDQYQFSANTSLIPGGTLGVFARSGENSAVTINFSELEIYAVAP